MDYDINMPSINIQKLTSDSILVVSTKIMEKIKEQIQQKLALTSQVILI